MYSLKLQSILSPKTVCLQILEMLCKDSKLRLKLWENPFNLKLADANENRANKGFPLLRNPCDVNLHKNQVKCIVM